MSNNELVYKFIDKPGVLKLIRVLSAHLDKYEVINAFNEINKWGNWEIESAEHTLNSYYSGNTADLHVCLIIIRNRSNDNDFKYWDRKIANYERKLRHNRIKK